LKDEVDKYDAERKNKFAVDSRDIKLHYLYNQVMTDATPENHQALAEEIAHRMKIDKIFNEVFPQYMSAVKAGENPPITEWGCYKKMIEEFKATCLGEDADSEYAMKYLGAFAHECHAIGGKPQSMLEGMVDVNAKMVQACKKS
jgi:hypothetical protein